MFLLSAATFSLTAAASFEGTELLNLFRRMTLPSGFGMPSPSYTSASGDYVAREEANCDGFSYIETREECELAAQDLGLPDQEATYLNEPGGVQATGMQRGCILFMHSHLFFNLDGLEAGEPNPLLAHTICKVAAVTEAPATTTAAAPAPATEAEAPVEQSLECRAWCDMSTRAWDTKCTWTTCGGCDPCLEAATTPAATTLAPNSSDGDDAASGECKNWCSSSPTPWETKCQWQSGHCSACAECEDVVLPEEQCMSWCSGHSAPWETKCAWSSRKCSACSECSPAGL